MTFLIHGYDTNHEGHATAIRASSIPVWTRNRRRITRAMSLWDGDTCNRASNRKNESISTQRHSDVVFTRILTAKLRMD